MFLMQKYEYPSDFLYFIIIICFIQNFRRDWNFDPLLRYQTTFHIHPLTSVITSYSTL